jgi:hypothetical protein
VFAIKLSAAPRRSCSCSMAVRGEGGRSSSMLGLWPKAADRKRPATCLHRWPARFQLNP